MNGINLSEWALKHRPLVAYMMIIAVVTGTLAYFRLGRNEDPAFIIKTMVVQASWPGASVDETVKQVTERLERTLQETPHLDFLRELAVSHAAGGYLFVHAGIRPGIPLERQNQHDLLWIREPFLSSKEPLGVVVVHGHTPRPQPVVRTNRIGIDTGAVMGGALTCAVLEEDRLGFITA